MHHFAAIAFPEWIPAAITLLVLGGAIVGFVREILPPEITALSALLVLLVTGVLDTHEAFAGFGHPATVSVAAVLVLSAGLERTGAVGFIARRLLSPLGRSELLLTIGVMLTIGVLSAFINNTAAVAVFIPVVLEACSRSGASPGRILMPMAHTATMAGMCTLIGTSTNLAAHEYAVSQGLLGFGMFELGRVALPILAAGFLYMLLIGRWFLPGGPHQLPSLDVRPGSYLAAVVVQSGSPWIGREIRPGHLMKDHDVELVEVLRNRLSILGIPGERFQSGDRLRVRGKLESLLNFGTKQGLLIRRPTLEQEEPAFLPREGHKPNAETEAHAKAQEDDPAVLTPIVIQEIVVLPRSALVGLSLRSARFAEQYGAVVLALHRPGEELFERPEDVHIRAGDVLVIEGEPSAMKRLAETRDFLMIGTLAIPEERTGKVAIAVLTTVGVVVVAALGWIPIVTAATAGCIVLLATNCLKPLEAYRAIDLRIVFMLAGTLALGTALEKTGIAGFIGSSLAHLAPLTGTYFILMGFFVAALLLSELISNSGTILLLAPVAMASAEQAGMNPLALLAAATFGSSAAFAMPIGYQTSLMVYGPGGYRFRDFIRMGIPLDLLVAALALWLIPRYWPLSVP